LRKEKKKHAVSVMNSLTAKAAKSFTEAAALVVILTSLHLQSFLIDVISF